MPPMLPGPRVLKSCVLAERYERKSVLIASNGVFSEWDRIFKDPMTTVAAIDHLVHHSVILEMTETSVRTEAAEHPTCLAGQGREDAGST